eukprot:gene2547-4973_t
MADENRGGEKSSRDRGNNSRDGENNSRGRHNGRGRSNGRGQGEGRGNGRGQGEGRGNGRGQGEGRGNGRGQGGGRGNGQGQGQGNNESQNWRHDNESRRVRYGRGDWSSNNNNQGNSARYNPNYNNDEWNRRREVADINTTAHHIPMVSVDIKRFWDQLSMRLDKPSRANKSTEKIIFIDIHNENERQNWFHVWTAAAAGANGHFEILPRALLLLPRIAIATPPPEDIINVLLRIIQKKNVSSIVLEQIVDIIRDRLPDCIQSIQDPTGLLDQVDKLERGFRDSIRQLTSNPNEDDDKIGILFTRVKDFQNYKSILRKLPTNEMKLTDINYNITNALTNQINEIHMKPWIGWKSPTMNWLMSPDWHDTKPFRSVYKSPEEYAETLLRMWTLLTFYWGAGAVSPRCHQKAIGNNINDPNAVCGEPLLTMVDNINIRCNHHRNGKICGEKAIWKCHRRDHHAMCVHCCFHTQESLINIPGQHASTDIYDAFVERETTRRDGLVFILSGLQSRKPPRIAPNWRTSYRLQVSALVAVVRLGASRERLKRESAIQWAEVVAVNPLDSRGEADQRGRGKIALRLLGRGDCSALGVEADSPLDVGSCIAIIDLRVFVPEVISVLATFANDMFCDHITQIPFIGNLIGQPTDLPRPLMNIEEELGGNNIHNHVLIQQHYIQDAIDKSEIEYIKRLDFHQKLLLSDKIFQLPQVKTLYGTQLQAFLAGLSSADHLGQSYIGVCLILALDIIRTFITSAGYTVGPVLILSYKNHALDEFLTDVLKFSPYKLAPGMLIRSGKPENEALLSFAERSSHAEKSAQEILMKRISVQRQIRRIARDWKDCAKYIEMLLSHGDFYSHRPWLSQSDSSIDPQQQQQQQNNNNNNTLRKDYSHTSGALLWTLLLLTDLCKDGSDLPELTRADIINRSAEDAYNLIENLRCTNIFEIHPKYHNMVDSLMNTLIKLIEGAEHWKLANVNNNNNNNNNEILELFMWLQAWEKGAVPPPRCLGYMGAVVAGAGIRGNNDDVHAQRCLEHAYLPGPYCIAIHNCQSRVHANCDAIRFVRNVPYCDMHRCLDDSQLPRHCALERLEGSEYCNNHSCQGCVKSMSRPIAKKLVFACNRHQCVGNLIPAAVDENRMPCPCPHLRLWPHAYCAEHLCIECKNTNTVMNLPKNSIQSQFCRGHKCIIPTCQLLKYINQFGVRIGYCEKHVCVLCILTHVEHPNAVDINCPKSRLCKDHRCSHAEYECEQARLPNNSSFFCQLHTCRICMDFGMFGNLPVIEDYPRNVCFNHPLCNFIGRNGDVCCYLATDGSFCAIHGYEQTVAMIAEIETKAVQVIPDLNENDGYCWGIAKKKKKRCQTQGSNPMGGKWYCDAHKDQADTKGAVTSNTATTAVSKSDQNKVQQNPVDVKGSDSSSNNRDQNISLLGRILGYGNSNDGSGSGGGTEEHKESSASGIGNDSGNTHVVVYSQTCAYPQCKVTCSTLTPDAWYCETHKNNNNSTHTSPVYGHVSVPTASTGASSSGATNPSYDHKAKEEVDMRIVTEEDFEDMTEFADIEIPVDINPIQEDQDDTLPLPSPSPLIGTNDEPQKVEEVWNNDEEQYDYVDALGYGIDADEMDIIPDNDNDNGNNNSNVEEGDNENMIHLKEVLDNESEEDSQSDDDEHGNDNDNDRDGGGQNIANNTSVNDSYLDSLRYINNNSNNQNLETFEDIINEIQNWNWEMSQHERYFAIAKFILFMSNILTKLRITADAHVSQARRNKAEAGAQAFRTARIVGATVVGAARRLEAIRAAEPFAVVVEEACEVMEPTLISVLAVKSLRKLELIGDHRQLPAFVQNCWYNLETTNPTIKTSLFERLVSGKVTGYGGGGGGGRDREKNDDIAEVLPFTVLDEQRRMRPVISDITRPDYTDLVEILDHEHTLVKCVGDTVLTDKNVSKQVKDRLNLHRSLWPSKGRQVPGMSTSIFFWDLASSKQGRPVAGLSACNPAEAEAVVGLARWLLICGVPPSSISIITPYKGQKTTIISELRKAKCLPPAQRHFDHGHGNNNGNRPGTVIQQNNNNNNDSMITVSTVDRYQGDENDVVILSLVRTQPGNRFVGLKNRFIVAVSRARLGFYVIGSVDGVTKKAGGHSGGGGGGSNHWNRFVTDLKTIPDEFVDSDLDMFAEERVGDSLPICCPRHPGVRQSKVKDPKKFPMPEPIEWKSFCQEACSYMIPECGHRCSIACHSPSAIPHTKQKECKTLVQRSCLVHFDQPLLCSDVPFAPQQTLAIALSRMKCDILVSYRRPECDHVVELPCHKHQSIEDGTSFLKDCEVIVGDYIIPNCGHVIKKPKCAIRRKYENDPPQCVALVDYQRPCKCIIRMPCWERSQETVTPPLCKSAVQHPRPRCSHKISIRCHISTIMDRRWEVTDAISVDIENNYIHENNNNDIITVQNGIEYGLSESEMVPEENIPECLVPVNYIGKCGHIFHGIPCSNAFVLATHDEMEQPKCDTIVEFKSPLCCHTVKCECWVAEILTQWDPWMTTHPPALDAKGHLRIHESVLYANPPPLPSKKLIKVLERLCFNSFEIIRLCNKDHIVTMKCNQLYNIMQQKKALPLCTQNVNRLLPCQHNAIVLCHSLNSPPPICNQNVNDIYSYPCGNHHVSALTCDRYHKLLQIEDAKCPVQILCTRYRCGHHVHLPCHMREETEEELPGERLVPSIDNNSNNNNMNMNMNMGNIGYCVQANTMYCGVSPDIPECFDMVSYRMPCGHTISDIPCQTAFNWALGIEPNPRCDYIEFLDNPVCGHKITTPCWMSSLLREEWDPWGDEGPPSETIVDSTDEHGDMVLCRVVRSDTRHPIPPPDVIPRDVLRCSGTVTLMRDCGHVSKIHCMEAYSHTYGPCLETVSKQCENENCKCNRIYPCHVYENMIATGEKDPCRNKINKRCPRCNINETLVECFRNDFICNKQVTIPLECHHTITWTCGRGSDPRLLEYSEICRACVTDKWENLARTVIIPTNDDIHNFERNIREHIRWNMSSLCEVVNDPFNINLPQKIQNHLGSRHNMMKAYSDMLQTNKKVPVVLPPPIFGSNEDKHFYDICFLQISSKEPTDANGINNINQKFSRGKQTSYGHGILLNILNSKNIKILKPEADGLIRICIGVVYRHKVLADTPPFFPMTNNNHGKSRNNNKNKTEKQVENSNKNIENQKAKGYDCVDVIKQDKDKAPNGQRVYWYPDSAIPLFIYTIKLHEFCVICMDHYTENQGISCCNKHFICWDSCFSDYLQSASTPDAIGRSVDDEGRLSCPECTDKYTVDKVSKGGAPPEIVESLINLKVVLATNKEVKKALEEQAKQLKEEHDRIMRMENINERQAALLRLKIIEEILILRCPRCKVAFADFDGCFALTCSVPCRAGFCAWCLTDCGTDAHGHVAQCPHRPATVHGYFGTKEQFEEHHRNRRRKKVMDCIAKETSVEVQRYVKDMLRKDLRDLGIEIP